MGLVAREIIYWCIRFSVGAVNREGGAHAPSNGVLGGLGFWVLVFTILGK